MGTLHGILSLLALAKAGMPGLLLVAIMSYLFASTFLVVWVGWQEHRPGGVVGEQAAAGQAGSTSPCGVP